MIQNTPLSSYMHEASMHVKSWLSVPYNYFYVTIYLALGIAFALHPDHRITQELAAELPFVDVSGRFIGQMLGTLFLLLSFVLWKEEPKGKWITYAAMPAAVWGCYTIVNILDNASSSWVTAVFVAIAIGAVVYNGELRQTLENNELVNERLIKEAIAKDAEIASLKAAQVKNDQ